jgi:peptidoglycan-associated lipoprotein
MTRGAAWQFACGRRLGPAPVLALLVALSASTTLVWSAASLAEERMKLGASDGLGSGIGREFRSSVGDRVFFPDRSAELSARARLAIDAQAQWLKHKPGLAVLVEGHADDSGTSDDNMQLSRQRADAVRVRLIEVGIAAERIGITAFGRNQTVADCSGLLCSAQNRRAVTIVRPGMPVPATTPGPARKAEGALEPWRRAARRLF